MEGYSNVSDNFEDFDDLNIEGRQPSDKKEVFNEDSARGKVESKADQHKKLLEQKVKIAEGGYGYVFSLIYVNKDGERWRCNLCEQRIYTTESVHTHIQAKKHQVKLALPAHPRSLFPRIVSEPSAIDVPKLAPGEPVPPGFEDVVKQVPQIQSTLDSYNEAPLIGLEYLVEITPEEEGTEPKYVCMLCDKKGDPRVAMAHLPSYNHAMKYISIHFPKLKVAMENEFPRTMKDGRKFNVLCVKKVVSEIEKQCGRLRPLVVDAMQYEKDPTTVYNRILQGKHFKGTENEFVEFVDRKLYENEDGTVVEDDSSSKFSKGKISCDRSRLRVRDIDDLSEEEVFRKLEEMSRNTEKILQKQKASGERKTDQVVRAASLSSISSTSTFSKSRSKSRSRSRGRSRSGSPYRTFRTSRYDRREIRGRPSRKYRRSRSSSRSRSPYRRRRSRSRSRSPRGKYRYDRHRSPYSKRSEKDSKDREKSDKDSKFASSEKRLWVTYRAEADKLESEASKLLKFHEKNPEKHPLYPEEWKKFWNKRYKELQSEGKDPSTHDFKPEWIDFWGKRMRELHEDDLKVKKEELKSKLGLPNEEVPKPLRKRKEPFDDDVIILSPASSNERDNAKKDVTVSDIKNTWKALTGSDIKEPKRRSPSPWDHHSRSWSPGNRFSNKGLKFNPKGKSKRVYASSDEPAIITTLRLLTALENQLGSLGPKVNNMMAQSLAMEKSEPGSSETLLLDSDNVVMFETLKEKLRGQLLAGIVERNMVMATHTCVEKLGALISSVDDVLAKRKKFYERPVESKLVIPPSLSPFPPTKSVVTTETAVLTPPSTISEPIVVPGIGTVDKVAIAQQIAAALVAQGKTDVTQEELEQLINAVVGMAHASNVSDKPVTAATFLSAVQQNSVNTESDLSPVSRPIQDHAQTPLQTLLSVVTSKPSISSNNNYSESRISGGLQMLQSAYQEPRSTDSMNLKHPSPMFSSVTVKNKSDSMDDLSEEDLKNLLQNFKDLTSEEQHGLISYLKKLELKDPMRVEKLRKFVKHDPLQQEVNSSVASKAASPSPEFFKYSSIPSGRLSPFSSRFGGANPTLDEKAHKDSLVEDKKSASNLDLDSDDEYSFEDIYAAASKKVKERELAKAEEIKQKELQQETKGKDDPSVILRETKAMIANLMGQLPTKYTQKNNTPVSFKTTVPVPEAVKTAVEVPQDPNPVSMHETQPDVTHNQYDNSSASYSSQYDDHTQQAYGSYPNNYDANYNNGYYDNVGQPQQYRQYGPPGYQDNYSDQQQYHMQYSQQSYGSNSYNQYQGQHPGYY